MTDEIKSIIKVASIYVATIIGAGFASGREIVQFFSSYYKGGFYGIILAGVLFAIIGYSVLNKVYTERIRNYEEFIFPLVGWFLGWIIEIAVSLFMLSVFCIMIAGAGNVFTDSIGIPFNYGVVIMGIICMIVILTDIKGIVAISTIVTPILIIGITAVGLYIIASKNLSVFSAASTFEIMTKNWFFSALLYVGYNSMISIVVMCSLLPQLKTRRVGILGGILGGLTLCMVAFILNFALFAFVPDVLSKELPVLSITAKYSSLISGFYALVLWLAMFISAVTAGYCFVDRISNKVRVNKKLIIAIICAIVIPLSNFGFSNLISTVYPIFGYVGLFVVFVTLLQGFKVSFAFGGKKSRDKKHNNTRPHSLK